MLNGKSSPNHSILDYQKNGMHGAPSRRSFCVLKHLKLKNSHRLVIGQININSIRNKSGPFKKIVKGNLYLIVVTESKLDECFPQQQFLIEGYNLPFRDYRNRNGGGILIYVREDIPCREIEKIHSTKRNLEGIFLELHLRRSKMFLFRRYNYTKSNIDTFLGNLGQILDRNQSKFEHFLLFGDFNSEIQESSISNFCDTYNLKNKINEPTCYKNILNPSTIDLVLTNKSKSFQNSTTIDPGLSHHHKITVTAMKQYFPEQTPVRIKYRNFQTIDNSVVREELHQKLIWSDRYFY